MHPTDSSAGSSAAVITADVGDLTRTVAALRALATEIATRDLLVDDLADPELAAALRRVEGDWSSQRLRLRTYLTGAAQALADAAAAYTQIDSQLAAATRPGIDHGG